MHQLQFGRVVQCAVAITLACLLTACGTAKKPVELTIPTDPFYAPEQTLPPQASSGSLYTASYGVDFIQPWKPRKVGDHLTVVLDENLRSTTQRNANVSRSGSTNFGVPLISGLPFRSSLDDLTLEANGGTDFTGQGATSSSNRLTGQITVTVRHVLPNGNLVIAGEKQIGNNTDTERVRLTGTVDPKNIRNGQIISTAVADARLEYVGSGSSSNASSPGWFTELLLYFNPF